MKPGRADDRVHAVRRRTSARLSRAASSTVKSTATSAPASSSASALADDLQAACRATPSCAEIDARVERVDRGDELEVGGRRCTRLAHGRAHAAAGAEHPDPDHRRRVPPACSTRTGYAELLASCGPTTATSARVT